MTLKVSDIMTYKWRMKSWKKILVALVLLVALALVIYPHIVIDTGDRLIVCNYDGDFSEYETNQSYNEVYCYNEKYDVSICTFDVSNFLFFHVISMEYVEGDVRETEFILEESYITHFWENAEIEDNENNIDIAQLIEGKEAIVGNTRYLGNDYINGIFYVLDGKYEEMYVFYADDLLVIQVGSPDEQPRYIAYK